MVGNPYSCDHNVDIHYTSVDFMLWLNYTDVILLVNNSCEIKVWCVHKISANIHSYNVNVIIIISESGFFAIMACYSASRWQV